MMIKLNILVVIILLIQFVFGNSPIPADHLLPPAIGNVFSGQSVARPPVEKSGFMQRIARWFGFGKQPKEQEIQASNHYVQYKDVPISSRLHSYNRPKLNCNLCNKVPWIPMFPGNVQYPILKSHSQLPQLPQIKFNYLPSAHVSFSTYNPPYSSSSSSPYAPNYNFHSVHVQRAIKFRPAASNHNVNIVNSDVVTPSKSFQYFTNPSSVSVSTTPFPQFHSTLYSELTKNDRYQRLSNHKIEYSDVEIISTQRPTTVDYVPTQQADSSIEIIKSVPVADFISSVEYPPNIVQSPIIDVSHQQNFNRVEDEIPELVTQTPFNEDEYSRTDLSSNPIVVYNRNADFDNYPEASSHNVSFDQQQQPQEIHSFETAIEKSEISSQDTKNFVTSYQETFETTEQMETTVTNKIYVDITTPSTTLSTAPSTTPSTTPSITPSTAPPVTYYPFNRIDVRQANFTKRERQTPKQLLDSPIFYIPGSSPRPFTRDPGDLKIQNYSKQSYSTPWAFLPTPTSSYPAVDASGHWAGIAPPFQFKPTPNPHNNLSEKRPKHIHQLIIPYTTKVKPRPFKARDEQNDQPIQNERYGNSLVPTEFHEEQESKLVTATESPNRKTTQYLTKIFALNLRDLLRKEQETQNNSKSVFDIRKLQKNIDDWTEQEFTSSKRMTTVSVRGRSKHIPTEYLTTTPIVIRHFETTSSRNDISNTTMVVQKNSRETQKYEILEKIINNNENEIDSTQLHLVSSTVSSTESKTPYYAQSVAVTPSFNDLWKSLKVTISPFTNEKVYIVTPQPSNFQNENSLNTFKSPRFFVRPTPANSIDQFRNVKKPSTQSYTPELFGLMGISSYSPPAPVETLDGHSKVITVVTASSKGEKSDIPITLINSKNLESTNNEIFNQNKS